MHDNDLAGLIAMRMRVLFGRAAVRCPTRVTDAIVSVERIQTNALFQIPELPFRTAQLEMLRTIDHSDTRRIVTAILELSQSVNDQRYDLFISNVSDNSTHN